MSFGGTAFLRWFFYLWSRQESNLDLVFRKHLFYPLNYGTIESLGPEDGKNNHSFYLDLH